MEGSFGPEGPQDDSGMQGREQIPRGWSLLGMTKDENAFGMIRSRRGALDCRDPSGLKALRMTSVDKR